MQAEAIKDGKKFEFTCKFLKKKSLDVSDYQAVFTITPCQLLNYLKSRYELRDLVRNSPSKHDGYYIVSDENGLIAYRQERGVRFNETPFASVNDAWVHYVYVELGYECRA